MDCDPTHFVALELDLTCMDPGTSSEPVRSGGIDHGRRPAHGAGRAVEEDEEAVPGGLRLASAKALDLGAYRLVVLGQQQPPSGVA
jgi:hypothetical protein